MKNIILIVLMAVFSYAQSTFSDPQPTFEKPRKIVINIHYNDLETVNHNIGTIYNILKEYPSETLKVAVVLYGKGMRVIKKDYDAATLNRIKSLMQYDVEFIACKNTMETMKWTQDDFISGVDYVQAGIVEVIERQNDGYFGITPY